MTDSLTDDEYERRFLLADLDGVLKNAAGFQLIEQAYMWKGEGYAVRVRLISDNEDDLSTAVAFLTLKGPRKDSHRYEVETQISVEHAREVIAATHNSITKKRFGVISEGNAWVIDIFAGANKGLALAEFEGSAGAVQSLKKPWWAGDEITADQRYNNEELAYRPWPFEDDSKRS